MPAVNTLATLQANPLLNHAFTEAELRLFATHLRIGEFGADMPIMQEGEPANRMMFLISGEADVISNGVRLARLKPRSFFGEGMFCRDAVRVADVVARDRCLVAIFSLDNYQDFLNAAPESAIKFSRFFENQRQEKALAKDRVLDRVDIWGQELTAWLEAGAPLRR